MVAPSLRPRRLLLLRALLVLVLVLVLVLARDVSADAFAPNHFLGSCLTPQWVRDVEAQLGISATERDSLGRLAHPFLHKALQQTRFRVHDARTQTPLAYAAPDVPAAAVLYGVGAVVDKNDGTVLRRGEIDGALVLELSGWTSHSLTTLVFSILARETLGYPVAHYYVTNTLDLTQRMSSVRSGETSPTHVNLEVWIAGIEATLQVYANESFLAGGTGYFGRSGLYTSVDFVRDSLNTTKHSTPLYANFWQGYALNEELIEAVPVSALRNNSAHFPPLDPGCADDSFGCRGHCSKTHACTLREDNDHKECMVVAMMYDYYDPGYLQAVLANAGIPAYFCFIGYGGAQDFALDMQQRGQPVLFYHFEPDLFHFNNPGLFDRVFLPRSLPERVVLATGSFGELGYGEPTTNPVDVDFPTTRLSKYASSVVQADPALVRLIAQFSISELHINDLLRKYLSASAPRASAATDPTFVAACNWVKENYGTWNLWLERLPVCQFASHVHYEVSGCETEGEDDSARTISFSWRVPHPEDPLVAYDCDGGMTTLPAPVQTSRSCEWILADVSRWSSWVDTGKPMCDPSFYKYNVSACDTSAQRSVRYWWLLPDPSDPSRSLECIGGAKLPSDVKVQCDHMPYSSAAFVTIASIDGALVLLLVASMVFVFVNRNMPIIKRSQYELLLLMPVGGVLVCGAVILYAGAPTPFLCGARPVVMSTGFSTIFGALLVKSLRVYRVFMRSAFKKNTVGVRSMLKFFFIILAVDLAIISTWYIVDFPEPSSVVRRALEFDGDIENRVCASSSFLFTAMLFFWKSIVLFVGLYISFLIRKVSEDFQESIWTFGSCVLVLVGCLVVLPLAYVVELAAATFYLFLSSTLLVCTALVMAFMLLPKVLKLRSAQVDTSSSKNSLNVRIASRRSNASKADLSRVSSANGEREEDDDDDRNGGKSGSSSPHKDKKTVVSKIVKISLGPKIPMRSNSTKVTALSKAESVEVPNTIE